jgi:urease accessory protein
MTRRPEERLDLYRGHRTALLTVCFLLLSYSGVADAHLREVGAGGFLTGLEHPISGLDHIVAMVAVGLWGTQLGRPYIWVLPVTFPLVMALGGFLGLIGIPLPGAELGIACSAILLGAAVLFELRLPMVIAAVLVGGFAIFHGYAHGTELPAGQSGLLFSLGFVMATGLLHGLGILIGLIHRWPWGRVALRAAGAGVLTCGGLFLWQSLA